MEQRTTTPLEAPVAEVTLFEDRAQVLRRGSVQLEAGVHRLKLERVTPVLADRSLRAELKGEGDTGAKLLDFRAKRERVASQDKLPQAMKELRAEELRRSQALKTLQMRKDLCDAERKQLEVVRTQLIAEAADDVGWSRGAPERWRRDLSALSERQAVLDGAYLDLVDGLEDAERELELLRVRMSQQADVSSLLQGWLEIDLELDRPGRVQLELGYMVPGACWRPRYRATLQEGASPTLVIEQQASVWQHTGEDWRDVQLHFSTQRPSLGTEPPQLDEDLLRVRPKQDQVVVEVREQQIHTTGLGQKRDQAQELPGVDDGGEPVSLRSEHPATVPSDGRPYRVSIGRSDADAEVERVVMAERVGTVLLRCTSTNRLDHPLLAGPVDLVAESGRVGRTELRFAAAGERLELGFGPDASLRVFRRAEQVEQEQGMLSRWDATDHHVEIKLSNLGERAVVVQVVERVPVSEVEQVKIEMNEKRTTAGNTPDRDGFLRWERHLAAGATDTVELAYTIKKRGNVVGG